MSRRRPNSSPPVPLRLDAVLQELLSHAVLLGMAWFSGLGYLGVILMLAGEMVLMNLLSVLIYRERSLARHLGDLLKFSALMAFLLMFVFLSYGVALVGHSGEPMPAAIQAAIDLDTDLLGWTLAYAAVHLCAILVLTRTRPDPRKEWARLALAQGGVTFVAVFCLIFVVTFLGPPIIDIVRWVFPEVAAGVVLAPFAVALRFALALVMSRVSEESLAQMGSNPYVD